MDNNQGLNVENKNIAKCISDPCATVTTKSESLTEQFNVTPSAITTGTAYVKIPVLLQETNITIPVEATITFDQPVREIKRIKKNVYLTQSYLLPNTRTNVMTTNNGILFIAGFVRKNIEYATQTCITADTNTTNFCGDIRHCTVEIPFNFTTRITFLRPPVFAPNTTPTELEYFTDSLQGCDICAQPVLGRNPCEQVFRFTENFNEKPFVELVSAVISEVDIHANPTIRCAIPTEQLFTEITEKLIINLTLKVLQKQQVNIQAVAPAPV